tara:strand:+ start:1336 stop:1950 length:615 start_codon:yes stop_codon:yes gene_type:complete
MYRNISAKKCKFWARSSIVNSVRYLTSNRPPKHGGRHELSNLIKPNSISLELGVASGYFSESILQNSKVGQHFSIDLWGDHHDSLEYIKCATRLSRFNDRSVVMRMDFSSALLIFPDHFFDTIYIDAYAHTGQQNGQLLENWWNKLKPGGIFSGHDYDEKWPQTVSSVNQFCELKKLKVHIFSGIKNKVLEDGYSSWYTFKSED